jgi:hypothetical protein
MADETCVIYCCGSEIVLAVFFYFTVSAGTGRHARRASELPWME